jgi:hypothetical protein
LAVVVVAGGPGDGDAGVAVAGFTAVVGADTAPGIGRPMAVTGGIGTIGACCGTLPGWVVFAGAVLGGAELVIVVLGAGFSATVGAGVLGAGAIDDGAGGAVVVAAVDVAGLVALGVGACGAGVDAVLGATLSVGPAGPAVGDGPVGAMPVGAAPADEAGGVVLDPAGGVAGFAACCADVRVGFAD